MHHSNTRRGKEIKSTNIFSLHITTKQPEYLFYKKYAVK